MTVLILAGLSGDCADIHAQTVAEKIARRGGETIFIDCSGGTLFEFSMSARGEASIRVDHRDVVDVPLVWNRAKIFPDMVACPDQREEFVRRSEWLGGYRSIARHFAGRIVNDPVAELRCGPKTDQQRIAAGLGLAVPPTLITNCRDAALRFAGEHGELICKPLGRENLPYDPALERPAGVVTCAVGLDDIAAYPDEEFARSATMFQRRIPKKWEYRVSAAAGKLFAFRLYSQEIEHAKVDSRLGQMTMRHEFVTLPGTIEESLLAFLDAFGLWQGQFDLIEDPDGVIWFVECNPNGQWLWLDRFADGALSDWYAEALLATARLRSTSQASPNLPLTPRQAMSVDGEQPSTMRAGSNGHPAHLEHPHGPRIAER